MTSLVRIHAHRADTDSVVCAAPFRPRFAALMTAVQHLDGVAAQPVPLVPAHPMSNDTFAQFAFASDADVTCVEAGLIEFINATFYHALHDDELFVALRADSPDGRVVRLQKLYFAFTLIRVAAARIVPYEPLPPAYADDM